MSAPYWCCYEVMVRLDAERFQCPDCGRVEVEAVMIAEEERVDSWTCSHGMTYDLPRGKRGPKGFRPV